MLKYIENSIAENVTNADIRAIHEQVDAVRQDKEIEKINKNITNILAFYKKKRYNRS